MNNKKLLTFERGSLLTTPHPLFREIFPMVCVEIRKKCSQNAHFHIISEEIPCFGLFLVIFLAFPPFPNTFLPEICNINTLPLQFCTRKCCIKTEIMKV